MACRSYRGSFSCSASGPQLGLVNAYMTVIAGIPSFIVTLAMLGIAQGLAFVLTGAQTISGFPHGYAVLGQGKVGSIPVPVFFLTRRLSRPAFPAEP